MLGMDDDKEEEDVIMREGSLEDDPY